MPSTVQNREPIAQVKLQPGVVGKEFLETESGVTLETEDSIPLEIE